MTSLKGKTVFITGASKGIGKQLALQMAGLGAKVSLLARSEKELEETARAIEMNGGQCEFFVGDISNEADVNSAVENTIKKFTLSAIHFNALCCFFQFFFASCQ